MTIVKTNTYNSLQLKEEQYSQVSSEFKIIEALKQENCFGFYAYDGEIRVGFALLKEFAKNQFFLWDFIIDCKYQSRGKGKEFLQLLICVLSNEYSAKVITTTYVYGNTVAKNLYEKFGFIQTDVVNENDIHEVNMKLFL